MNAVTIVVAIVILAIAFKKELLSLFEKISTKERTREKEISPETKKFLKVIGAVILFIVIILGTFFLSIKLFPGEVGYWLGGVLDVILMAFTPLIFCEF